MIREVFIEQEEEWDRIVKSFHQYDIYYLNGYSKAFGKAGDGEPRLIYYENGQFRIINVVMKRDIAKEKFFAGKIAEDSFYDYATPYGYGGVLIDGEINENNLKLFDEEYSTFCRNNGIISEFVRFHPVLKNSEPFYNIYHITKLGKTITMDIADKGQIWANLTSKNRNMVRKALKSGTQIYWGRNKELYKLFIPMYQATMERVQADYYYFFKDEFYYCILNDLRFHSLIFYAVLDEKIIAMSLILFSNNQMHYHLSASVKEYQNFAPMNLLLYEAACWGSENGYKTFHLGGGKGSSEDSLYQFKSSFNKNSNTSFEIGKKIFQKDRYQQLVSIRNEGNSENKISDTNSDSINDFAFFPEYRRK